ncbi:MAG: hypothetical protein Q4B39_07115 [[Ruminococcus] gnavus]|nr:hypothetical protein [Mediterraneibacter gnavus]
MKNEKNGRMQGICMLPFLAEADRKSLAAEKGMCYDIYNKRRKG